MGKKKSRQQKYELPDLNKLNGFRLSCALFYLISAASAFTGISFIEEERLLAGMFSLILALVMILLGSARLSEYKRYSLIIDFFQENLEASVQTLSLATESKESTVRKDVNKLIEKCVLKAKLSEDRIELLNV